MKVKKVIISA